ncbi:hypothetical protein MN116_004428 [Schistosoma mekongi]|uniref:Neurexin n=1 Tax=Schistosoma mekongi TaxID=38744 RepID=A0AAE1ZHB0_SCHME|nr:hypothetical protein MN116_004428 [Schistosoma mekongi]
MIIYKMNLWKPNNTMNTFKCTNPKCKTCFNAMTGYANYGKRIITNKNKLRRLPEVNTFRHYRSISNDYYSKQLLQLTNLRDYDKSDLYSITFKEADCYLHNPGMHLYESFNLQFSFRTSQEHGLLLFNSNKHGVDFIAFELISSYLHFVFDMGSGSQRHILTMHKVADSDWHHVELSKRIITNKNKLRRLPEVNTFRHYRSISNDYYSKQLLQLTNLRDYDKSDLYSITFKEADCYLHNPGMHLYESFNLQFSFRTSQEHGLLLFNSNKHGVDFIAFELISSYLHFVFDMGSGSQRHILTMHKVADSDWHHVELSRIDLENNTFLLYVDRNKTNVQFIKVTVQNSVNARNFNLNDPLFIGGTSQYTFMKWRGKLNSYHGFQGCLSNFTINGLLAYNLLHLSKQKYALNWTIPICYDQIISGCIERPKDALNCNEIQNQPKQFSIKENKLNGNVNSQQFQQYCLNDGLCLHSWSTVKCACELTSFNGHRCTRAGTTFLYGSYHNRSTDIVSNNWNMTIMNKSIGYLRLLYKDHARNTRQDEFILGIQMFPVKIYNQSNYSMSIITTLLYVTSNIQKGDYMHLFLESGRVKLNYDIGGGIVHIIGPNISINDGLYHRIRGYRVDHQVILEVDYIKQTNIVNSTYGINFNNQEVIWVGHAPTSNKTDIFHGYMSGVYYNGLLVNDLAAGLLYLPFIQVEKYGSVKYAPTFQPLLAKSPQSDRLTYLTWIDSEHQINSKMPADSEITYINQIEYNNDIISNVTEKSHQFLQFTDSSTSSSPLDLITNNDMIRNMSLYNNHMFNINHNPLHSNKWKKYNTLKGVYMQVNLWLLISMTSVGVILLILLTILAYKCHHTKYNHNDCLHSKGITNDRLCKPYLSNKYVNVNCSSSNSLLKLNQIDYNKTKSFTEQFTTSSCYLPHRVLTQIPVTETYSSLTTIKPTSIIFVNESTDLPISSTLITTSEYILHNNPITHVCHISVNKSVIDDIDECILSSIEIGTDQPLENKTILI